MNNTVIVVLIVAIVLVVVLYFFTKGGLSTNAVKPEEAVEPFDVMTQRVDEKNIEVVVKDANSKPIKGVQVQHEKAKSKATTNNEGKAMIEVLKEGGGFSKIYLKYTNATGTERNVSYTMYESIENGSTTNGTTSFPEMPFPAMPSPEIPFPAMPSPAEPSPSPAAQVWWWTITHPLELIGAALGGSK